MAVEVCSALGLDTEDFTGKLITVEEQDGVEAKFVLSCIMSNKLRKDTGICLVALHNSFAHYQNVGTKLGYSLQQRQDNGYIEVVEFLQMLNNDWLTDSDCEEKTGYISDRPNVVKNLFFKIKEKIDRLAEKQKAVCLIIDDVSDLLSLGMSVKEVWSFIQYCRSLLLSVSNLSVVMLVHLFEEDEEQRLIAAGLAHVTDMHVEVAGLKTGQSSDVSGSIKVHHQTFDKDAALKQNVYHFKLTERQVKVFAPGIGIR